MVSKDEIRDWIATLACSQGFYGRLLEAFDDNPDKAERLVVAVNDAHIEDTVSFCMWIEGGY